LKESDACDIISKVVLAVNHCHANNIIHRDIKPENIMYGKDGEIKLIDFGLSKILDTKKVMNTIVGTPYYMAPEVIKGVYDKKCDIWSIGVLLYTLVSGYLPFTGKNRFVVYDKI